MWFYLPNAEMREAHLGIPAAHSAAGTTRVSSGARYKAFTKYSIVYSKCIIAMPRLLNPDVMPLFFIKAHFFSHLFELCSNSSCRYSHSYRLYSTNLFIRDPIFFGNSKEMLHSWITTNGERCCQLDHNRYFHI